MTKEVIKVYMIDIGLISNRLLFKAIISVLLTSTVLSFQRSLTSKTLTFCFYLHNIPKSIDGGGLTFYYCLKTRFIIFIRVL